MSACQEFAWTRFPLVEELEASSPPGEVSGRDSFKQLPLPDPRKSFAQMLCGHAQLTHVWLNGHSGSMSASVSDQ